MRGRSVPLAWVVGFLLLAATIGVPAWYLNRPMPPTTDASLPDDLDTVATGRVDAPGGVCSLDPPLPGGIVTDVHVTDGQEVKVGQPIVTIDDRAYADAEKDAIAARDAAKIEMEAIREKKDSRYPTEIAASKLELEAAMEELKGKEIKLEQLRQQGKLSQNLPLTSADIQAYEADIRAAKKKLEAQKKRIEQLEKYDASLETKAIQSKIDMAEAAIVKARRYKADCVVRAPMDGTIVRLTAAKGMMLAPGTPMEPAIVFAPAGPLVVRAEVEQADAGKLSIGQPVTIRDDSRRDSPTWTGHIVEISRWVAKKKDFSFDPGTFNDVRTLEVIIKLDPSQNRLWIGQRMVVRISRK